jgi:hypothetical protein
MYKYNSELYSDIPELFLLPAQMYRNNFFFLPGCFKTCFTSCSDVPELFFTSCSDVPELDEQPRSEAPSELPLFRSLRRNYPFPGGTRTKTFRVAVSVRTAPSNQPLTTTQPKPIWLNCCLVGWFLSFYGSVTSDNLMIKFYYITQFFNYLFAFFTAV